MDEVFIGWKNVKILYTKDYNLEKFLSLTM